MDANLNELNFIKQAIDSVTIKGSDSIFVAGIYSKLQKQIEKQAKKLQSLQPVNNSQQVK